MRTFLPRVITLLSALVVVISHYTGWGRELQLTAKLDRWLLVTISFAMALGVINLSRVHLSAVRFRKTGWVNSLALLISMFGFMLVGIWLGDTTAAYQWIFKAALVPLDATMFSLLAFFIVSASYRAFRVRNAETAVLLAAAVVVMMGQVPVGEAILKELPLLKNWVMRIPNAAAMRALTIGAYIGGLALTLRILLGLEKTHLG